jgi:Flp pilus assembly protein TadD
MEVGRMKQPGTGRKTFGRWIAPCAAAVIVAAALLALVLKGVPAGHQGVRIRPEGRSTHYGPGVHAVLPFSGKFVVYPNGSVERRFPPEGVYEGRTSGGEKLGVALSLSLEFKEDSGEFIYNAFGEDLWGRLSDIIRDIVQVETAGMSPESVSGEVLAGKIVGELQPALSDAGIRVAGYRVDALETARAVAAIAATSRPLRRIIFIGVDGGDWEIILPWMEKGYLPNFKRIVDEGAAGPMRTIEPILSPLIWTTMATGKLPEEHGILSFTLHDEKTGKQYPVTRASRRVDALWNILSDRGRTVDIVGWLATHPAEKINGLMVTDRAGYLAYAGGHDGDLFAPGIISPEDRASEVAGLVVESESLKYEEFRRVLDIDRATFDKEKAIAFDKLSPINNLIMLYATARTYQNITKHILADEHPDFLGVYYELCDAVGHLFMKYSPPRLDWIGEAEYEKYKDVMLNTYKLQDRIIGDALERSDGETVIMIASDHGFKNGSKRPRLSGDMREGHAAFWHQLDGILAFHGNGIRRGYKFQGATVLDVMPTILALQGFPQAGDMPGKVLIDVFEDSLAARVDRTVVATLESGRKSEAGEKVAESAGDEETMKKLEALGYITTMNPADYNNLGQRYQAKGEHEKAIEQFTKALEINPNLPGTLNNIGVSYGRLKRYDLAEAAFNKAISIKKNDIYAMNNLAIMYMEMGNLERAAEYGEMAIEIEPNYGNGHLTLGSVYATAGDFDRAEREFERVLELDGGNQRARANLEKVRSERAKAGGSAPGR